MARELGQDPHSVAPYRFFLDAMEIINPADQSILLDVGCGAGAYAVLCMRYYPKLCYRGTDFSRHMIKRAMELATQEHLEEVRPRFETCDFLANDFESPTIVLASSVLEYTGNFDALDYLLEHAPGWIILHRLRLTLEPSHAFSEATYAGQTENHFLWNRNELFTWIQRSRTLAHILDWGDQSSLTLIVAPSLMFDESLRLQQLANRCTPGNARVARVQMQQRRQAEAEKLKPKKRKPRGVPCESS